ncbi:MAG: hypothetical protein LBU90_02140 [Bacteroidales bacterium]|jgi:hypothetical protein|nr:hypothetical protein [Bacteroidales bacterium]
MNILKKIVYVIALCALCAACAHHTKKEVMNKTVNIDSTAIVKQFTFENNDEKNPATVFLTLSHDAGIDFKQLVLTFSHSFAGEESFAIPLGIPVVDARMNFTGTPQGDTVWQHEVVVLHEVYMHKGENILQFVSDEGRELHGVRSIGLRVEQ